MYLLNTEEIKFTYLLSVKIKIGYKVKFTLLDLFPIHTPYRHDNYVLKK